MDRQLDNYLRASEACLEQDQLSELMSAADPVIRRTVFARLSGRWDDIDDVCSEARLELLLHLRRVKAKPGPKSIDDFAAYVGTLARNTCRQYFRRRHSGRTRLRKQIGFLLQDDPEFKSWQNLRTTWCGKAGCSEDSRPRMLQVASVHADGSRDLATLLAQLFDAAGGAIEFEDLVNMVAHIWNIPPDIESGTDADLEGLPAAGQPAEITIDRRRYVERLWEEIRQLPRPQRVALLLHLRDAHGNPILGLFPFSGVASFSDTAAALEMVESQLAAIWIELPWDDNAIARFLGSARQQVINLRMAARKRLANRLGERPL
jgi:DNA-directed RNA polymerase specialized sigma24 family protein